MKAKSRRRVVTAAFAAPLMGGLLFSGCGGFIRVPGVNVDLSGDGVFINLLVGSVAVTDDGVQIDLPGINVDIRG